MERRRSAAVVGALLVAGTVLAAAGCGAIGGGGGRGGDRDAVDVVVGACRVGPDAECARMNLSGGDFIGADLRRADLRRANLQNAILRDADLRGADLRRADLRRADLSRADLRGALLAGTRLDNALMVGAEVDGPEQYDDARVCNVTRPDGSVTRRGCPKEAKQAPASLDLPLVNPTGYLRLGRTTCNTPVGSMIEVRIGAALTTMVELQLDGVSVRRISALMWLRDTPLSVVYPCDGKPHTYTLVVLAAGLQPYVVSKVVPPA